MNVCTTRKTVLRPRRFAIPGGGGGGEVLHLEEELEAVEPDTGSHHRSILEQHIA